MSRDTCSALWSRRNSSAHSMTTSATGPSPGDTRGSRLAGRVLPGQRESDQTGIKSCRLLSDGGKVLRSQKALDQGVHLLWERSCGPS